MSLPHILLSVAGIGLGVMCFVGLFLYQNAQMHEPHTQRSTRKDSSSYSNYYATTSHENNGSSNVRRRRDSEDQDKCSICLEVCISDSIKLQCSHQFHADCIQKWKEENINKTCPCCRAIIE